MYRHDVGQRIAGRIHTVSVSAQDAFPDVRRHFDLDESDRAVKVASPVTVTGIEFPTEFSGHKLRDINAFGTVMGYNSTVVGRIRSDRLAVHGFPSNSLIGIGQVSDFSARLKTAFMYSAYTGELFSEKSAWPSLDAEFDGYIPVRESEVTLRDSDASWFVAHVAMFVNQGDTSSYASYVSHITSSVSALCADETVRNEMGFPETFTEAVVERNKQSIKALGAAWKLADKTINEFHDDVMLYDSGDVDKTSSSADDRIIDEVEKQLNDCGLYLNTVFWAPDSTAVDKINAEIAVYHSESSEDSMDTEESARDLAPESESNEIPPIEFKKTSRGILYVRRPNGQRYYTRTMPVSTDKSPATDVEFIRRMYELKMPTLLYGDPGTGKTALAEVALPNLVTLNGTGDTETADFIGSWTPSGPDEYTWIDGPLITAMNNGWPLLIDEIALIDPRVMSIVYGVMDGRDEIHVTANPAVGTVKVKPGFYVIGACNPHVPGAVMSDALLSRFSVQLEITTDYSKLTQMGIKRDTSLAAKNLRKKQMNNEIMRAPQLRELFDFETLRKQLGVEIAVANMISSADENDRDVYESVLSSVFSIKTSRMTI